MSAVQYFDNESELYRISTRRERKLLNKRKRSAYKKQDIEQEVNVKFDLKRVEAKTENQQKAFDSFYNDQNLLLHGVAGTGKTFLALYLALESVLKGESPKPIVILRSVVPSRDSGFLPGKLEEKSAPFEGPYYGICSELTGHATAYENMKKTGLIQFSTTSHLRGLTFRGNTIIIDECQNMNFSELDTIMTRIGKNCRVIFCGDFRQTDFWRDEEKSGIHKFMDVVKTMDSFDAIEFTENDIQRSGVVKEYILAKLAQGMV